ncbi:MAG: 2-oxoglutarate:ferredoxin oxidoreductase, partial [Nitrospina sp.]|nr:2-oxoglutarate:ferredoxin oxidoreductase [Nitrospina sp.]
DGHEDALISIQDTDGKQIEKLIAAVKKVKKDGNFTPWALTSEGKEELERIAEFKRKNAAPNKEDATLFMADLEQGLDENAE